jgi:hypothetical protein
MPRTFADAYWAGKGRVGATKPAPTRPPAPKPNVVTWPDTDEDVDTDNDPED